MRTDGALTGDTCQTDEWGIVELHWMKEPDLTWHETSGLHVPALCGAWMAPDPGLADTIEGGATHIRYVSCRACDLLHELRADTDLIA